MVPTLGIYRFWVTTLKRRFYWNNTVVAGEPLEYTGNALQLLIGFLFALAFFLPIYMAFFFFSTQSQLVAIVGYGCVGALLWLLIGYAQYRGRDFRLSRTLWRGIRFDQRGSAVTYALRRFGWSLLVVVTLGLAYPLMVEDLWRYRYSNTWYGDRQFGFSATWRTIAGPFYRAYAALVTAGLFVALSFVSGFPGLVIASVLLFLAVAGGGFFYYRSREASGMFSAVHLGPVKVTVEVRARALLGQFGLYSVSLIATFVVIGFFGFFITAIAMSPFNLTALTLSNVAPASWTGMALAIGGYLSTLAAVSLLGEVFLDCGYWMLVARGARVSDVGSLGSVRASGEDKSLAGEGLADALNIGAY